MNKINRIQDALSNAEANIKYLASLSDSALAEKLDTVHLQTKLAEETRNTFSIELLEIWRAQIIEARIYKAENQIPDSPSEIELAIADIETLTDEAEVRRQIFSQTSEPSVSSEEEQKEKQNPDSPEQLTLF